MSEAELIPLQAWGRLAREPHRWIALADADAAAAQIAATAPGIAHGAGRSYGDVALNPRGTLWSTRGLDRFLRFDDASGLLTVEAGVLLRDIQRTFVPRGWMLPVTPGTQMVTVGGAIANDVHGKNHHVAGAFGHHVRRIQLLRTDGQTLELTPEATPRAFAATVGGLGLTGVMLAAELQLTRTDGPWLDTETLPFATLADFFALAGTSGREGWPYAVAWIDCLSAGAKRGALRGIFERAKPCPGAARPVPHPRELRMPFTPPVSPVNGLSLRLFNAAYFHLNRIRAGRALRHYEKFLYPLDHVHDWNRMYGPRGFYQYQCVVPGAGGEAAIADMLAAIAAWGEGSFLAVLKVQGDIAPVGMLSFAHPGVTLALDFPNRGESTLRLFERLDDIVADAQGRIYLAKDARWPRARFEAAYTRLPEFLPLRDAGISSAMSRRLMGS
ncbi:MAG: FAD-binding oxidoreductase [Burkholderiaceae bacterium]|jgi:FAD/FMN-containing dehydrogenase|nr:FAD-binding oxidoreductase [Burkholderiaceae bacterium]